MSTPGLTAPALTPLAAGFADPVLDAQAAFRRVLDAMARPGSIAVLPRPAEPPPAPLAPAAAALALALCDAETPVWLDAALAEGDAPGWLKFHCGCRIAADPQQALFAFAVAEPPTMTHLEPGSDLYPDRSATLVVQVDAFNRGEALRLSGPGIREALGVTVAGLPPGFVAQRARNLDVYPRGVDCVLVAGEQVMCLPRSTRVEAG